MVWREGVNSCGNDVPREWICVRESATRARACVLMSVRGYPPPHPFLSFWFGAVLWDSETSPLP